MDEIVEATILSYLPKARKIEDGEKGSCKILLPCPLKEMEECESLRRALNNSPARPTCLKCHSQNTRFRYFNNSSSKSLQARYKCMGCNQLFTFGGKRYMKQHSALAIKPKSQTSLMLKEASSDDHAMAMGMAMGMGGRERQYPAIHFFNQEGALYHSQDQLRQHTLTENDYLFGLQLCLYPPQAFTFK
ncbi:hypothetical protein SUGI_0624460 [Cryptomeria japonica]|nr:hypothetical protein SUGI_0624460 [Cryptomeria japonica]